MSETAARILVTVLTHLIASEEVASHRPSKDEYREEDRR